MNKINLSILFMLLCSVPVCASDITDGVLDDTFKEVVLEKTPEGILLITDVEEGSIIKSELVLGESVPTEDDKRMEELARRVSECEKSDEQTQSNILKCYGLVESCKKDTGGLSAQFCTLSYNYGVLAENVRKDLECAQKNRCELIESVNKNNERLAATELVQQQNKRAIGEFRVQYTALNKQTQDLQNAQVRQYDKLNKWEENQRNINDNLSQKLQAQDKLIQDLLNNRPAVAIQCYQDVLWVVKNYKNYPKRVACALDATAYLCASQVNLVNKMGPVDHLMQRLRFFGDQDQANLAVCSAITQGLFTTHQVFSLKKGKKSKKATILFKAFAQDFASNVIVANVKNKAVNCVVKPVAARCGIELPANKLCNAAIDALSWTVLRRTAEQISPLLLLLWRQTRSFIAIR